MNDERDPFDLFRVAQRMAATQFASAIDRYGMSADDIAALAVFRVWLACSRRPELRPRAILRGHVRWAGLTLIAREQRQVPVIEFDDAEDIGEGDAGHDDGMRLGLAALQAAIVEQTEQEIRKAGLRPDRVLCHNRARDVALEVARRLAEVPDYLRMLTDDPKVAVWNVVRETVPEFSCYPPDKVPAGASRRKAYRIIGRALALIGLSITSQDEED